MKPLRAIAYVSSATHLLTPGELDNLLTLSRELNARDGVTGALLHHDGNFLQYLEGEAESVKAVYARVCKSPLHHGLVELLDEPLTRRRFEGWYMGFAQTPGSWMQAMSQARWVGAIRGIDAAAEEESPGVGLLMQFWRQSRHLGAGPSPDPAAA
jgi:hypothetical protein